jgi:hypothetical protein
MSRMQVYSTCVERNCCIARPARKEIAPKYQLATPYLTTVSKYLSEITEGEKYETAQQGLKRLGDEYGNMQCISNI